MLLKEEFCGDDQLATLARIDALQGAAPGTVATGADLDEYYCIAVEHDQIELATPTAPVLFDQAQAVTFQMLASRLFGGSPQIVVCAQLMLSGRR
jgi:hypothetical protein